MADVTTPSHIFFSGTSWGCDFYIGVYRALQQKYGLDSLSKCKFAGNSAGALIALCAAAGLDWTIMEKVYLKCLHDAVDNGVFQKMSIYHNDALDAVLNDDEEIYKKLNKKLFVGITCFVNEYELISEWRNNHELRACVHASMHIPYYCSHIERVSVHGSWRRAIDGGFGSEVYRFNASSLVVAALSDKGDITPNPKLKRFKDCYSPNLEKYHKMHENGYQRMMEWDGRYKWDEYRECIRNKHRLKAKEKSIFFMLWFLRILQEVQIKRIMFVVLPMLLLQNINLSD